MIFGSIIFELSFVVGSIWEDKDALSLGSTFLEVSDINASVRLIHSSKS